jgi:hypothetical protein
MAVVGLLVLYASHAVQERRSRSASAHREGVVAPARSGEDPTAPAGATPPAPESGGAPGAPDASSPQVRIDAPGRDLGPLRTLHGHVRWTDGAPVKGAEVVLYSSPLNPFPRVAVARARVEAKDRTDAQGRFDLPWAPGGLFRLRVSLDGRERASVTEPPQGDEMEIVLAREGATLEIEAVDAATKEPVEVTSLQLQYAGGDGPDGWRVTCFDGGRNLRLTHLASGEAELFGSTEGHEAIDGEPVLLGEGETTHVRLELNAGETVRGKVLDDETGGPVAGATVSLYTSPISAETDARGAFELAHVPWDPRTRRTIEVRAEGYAHAERHVGATMDGGTEDGGTEELEIRLLRPATLSLRCVDGKGAPAADVLVLAETLTRIAPTSLGGDWKSAATGADGKVSIVLAPGDQSAKVTGWRKGARVFEREVPPLEPSERRDLGDFVVEEPQAIRGTVRTADGAPAAGSAVVVVPHDPEDTERNALAVAVIEADRGSLVDAKGRFEVRGVTPGLWDLLVHGGGHPRLLRVGIAVPERGDPPDLDLRLPVAVALTGRVVDAQGRPVPRARIAFLRAYPVAANLMEETAADTEGRFSIPGFTALDPAVELWVGREGGKDDDEIEFPAVPRDSPVEIRLP